MKNPAMQAEAVKRARTVLGDVRYAEHHRFPKWNIEPTVLEEPRLFKRVFPELSKDDHLARAKKFQAKARVVEAQWHKNIDKAIKLYGDHGAYISGVYREHFPATKKEVLRRLAHGSALLFKAAQAHWDAAGKRSPIQVFPRRDPAHESYQLPRHKDSPHRFGGGIIGRTTGKELHETSAESWRHSAEQIMAAVKAAYPSMKRLPAAAKTDVARAREFLRRAKLHEKRAGSKVTARASRRLLETELWKIWPKDFKLTGPGPRSIRMKTKDGYLDSKLSDLSDEEILHLLHPAHRSPAGRPPARKRVKSVRNVLSAGRRSFKKPSRRDPVRRAKVVRIDVVDVTRPQKKGEKGPREQVWNADAYNQQGNIVYSVVRAGTNGAERAFRAVANGTGYGPEAFEQVSPNNYELRGTRSYETKRDPAATGKVRCGLLLRRITKVAEESVRSKRIGTPQAILDSKGDWELVENLKKTAQKAGCSALQISEAVEDGVQFGRKAKLGESFWKKSSRRDPAFKACPIGTEVQSLILDQSHFDTRDAMGWAKRHGFRVSKVDTTEHSYRFRQREPSTFVHDSFRTITMRPGVKAVIGCPK